MLRRRKCLPATVLALVLALAASVAAPAQDPEPWGYVYVFRTLQVIPLVEDENLVGRLPQNEVTLDSPRVSRRHATIRRTGDGAEVVDIGSSNGSRLNGDELRAREPATLAPGDRIQLADELVLFHRTLDALWNDELRLRLLTSLVTLRLDLPGDFTRKSLGQERAVNVVTEATLDLEESRVDVAYPDDLDPQSRLAKDSDAFIGNVRLEDGVLELSLWAIDGDGPMTSRRASISRLKHSTLRVAISAGRGEVAGGPSGPWFAQNYLGNLIELKAEDRELSMRFASSLAIQETAVALRDAAETLWFRHRIRPGEADVLVLAARSQSGWVERMCLDKGQSLTAAERERLASELERARDWLERARALGAEGESVADAESVLTRAGSRLTSLGGQ